MGTKRASSLSKTRLRNLTQYKNLTDEEFEEKWEIIATGAQTVAEFEKRIERKIASFAEDYDLDDLKSNDMLTLRALAQAYINLEDYENVMYRLRGEGISDDNLIQLEKINNIMSSLRRDISNMQNDLKITRKIRKGDKEESIINLIEDLKEKANKFYQNRMSYIFCEKCRALLSTVWLSDYNHNVNKITLRCKRCEKTTTYPLKKIVESGGANITGVPKIFK